MCISVLSQNEIAMKKLTIEVRDSVTYQPLADAMCRVMNATGRLQGFKVADREGQISLSVRQEDVLTFSLIGYGKRKISVNNIQGQANQPIIVLLAPKQVQLKEVIVKLPPIRKQGDTLVYNVGSFLQKGDRHLEDVLKKLPGIKIAENGSVSYQGRAINRFYIEGQDLMGDNYTQATRNMPVNAVRDVEVMEDHQPIKLLQGRKPSESAALNIKLDKGHWARPFGEIKGGIDTRMKVWDNQLFLTQIMKHTQILVSAKMNNTGKDLSSETNERLNVYELDAFEPLPQGVLSGNIAQEELPQERYLHNKSISTGLNTIISLSKDATLRSNVLLYEDHAEYNHATSSYYGGLTPLTLETSEWLKQRTLRLIPTLKYEENSQKRFLSDELSYSLGRQSAFNQMTTNGTNITEQTRIRPSYVKNYLSSSFRIGQSLLQIRSLTRYSDRKEELETASDTQALYNTFERFITRSAMTRNIITTSIPVLGNDLDLSLQAYYKDNTYNYSSDFHHRTFKMKATPGYTWTYGRKSYISAELPMGWTRVSLAKDDGKLTTRSFMAFEPNLNIRQTVNDKLNITLSASLSTGDNALGFYALSPLRTGYRTIQVTGDDIYKSTRLYSALHLRYRNLVTMLFGNLSVAYSDTKAEAFSNFDYNDSLTTMHWIKGNNHRHNIRTNAMIDKTFTSIGLSIKADMAYEKTDFLIAQSGEMTQNHSHHATAGLSTSFQKLSWLRLSTAITANYYWERSSIRRSDVLSSYITNATLYLFPTKNTELKIKFYNLTNEVTDGHYHTCGLLDANLNYKINKVWEAGLTVTNLLNTKSYITTQYTGINTFTSTLPLRNREIMVHLQMRL